MGGPLSVTLANIALTKLEYLVIAPTNPNFYRRFADDVITKRDVNKENLLLKAMNSYHPKLKFTLEENPTKFLDTALEVHNNDVFTSVYREPNKILTHWSSNDTNVTQSKMIYTNLTE